VVAGFFPELGMDLGDHFESWLRAASASVDILKMNSLPKSPPPVLSNLPCGNPQMDAYLAGNCGKPPVPLDLRFSRACISWTCCLTANVKPCGRFPPNVTGMAEGYHNRQSGRTFAQMPKDGLLVDSAHPHGGRFEQ
jgi:hypothetical protein